MRIRERPDPKTGCRKESTRMKTTIEQFVCDERGATAIEYALIAVFVSIVFLAAAQAIGTTLNGALVTVSNALK